MPEYSKPLGDAVKDARHREGLSQNAVADRADIDVRTVINIENYRGNPKLEVLFPLVRALQIDPKEIFYPEAEQGAPSISRLRLLVETCNEEEAAMLIPVIEAVLTALRSNRSARIDLN